MKLDDVKKLHQKKYRQELEFFLVEGEHLVLELEKAANKFPLLHKSFIYATDTHIDIAPSFKKTLLSEKQMQQISETKSPQGVVAAVPIDFKNSLALSKPETLKAIYLNEIQDPGNLGTILRSAAWFGNFKILLSRNSVDPFNGKTVRASMGAIFHVDIQQEVELEEMKKNYSRIACLGMNGKSINSDSFKEFDCYIFGNEARGLDASILEVLKPTEFTILGSGTIDSLNLATAVSLSCYELNR